MTAQEETPNDSNAPPQTVGGAKVPISDGSVLSSEPCRDSMPSDETGQPAKEYLTGIRFWAVSIVIAVVLFLVNMEATVVATSLVAITDELGGFDIESWILSSYLLGYVGSIVLAAKLSDAFGRKTITLICIAIFTIFSGGCAAAASTTQIVILRAFQGLGGGGCFALATILLIELVPPHKYGQYVAYTGIAIAIGSVSGPLIGGAISAHTTWRWIFLINVPVGVVIFAGAYLGIPNGFPFHHENPTSSEKQKVAGHALEKLDIPGASLLLLASITLTAAFEQAGSRFAWNSPLIIVLLVLSPILWILLVLWERRVSLAGKSREPVLPWEFLTDRVIVGMLLGFFLLGAPITVTVFQLPQRFQLVNGLSGFDAGVRILPFAGGITVGSSIGAKLASQFRLPAVYVVLFGSSLQIIGLALMTTLPSSLSVPATVYGYQVIAGFGCGVSYAVLYLMIPFTTGRRDRAVGMGTGNQFRMMGSAVALAIATTIFRTYTAPAFAKVAIDPSNESDLAVRIMALTDSAREELRESLAAGYIRQSLVTVVFAAVQIPAALLMWKKDQVLVV
ncbi:hypothetical protein PFICI_10145 [Pestalotiopsis fici W106-1]|uniref:Major facilitator superfamily (MFS) profile domain-containing protein n=1 Tax=Pestalotiopsis fici (strain W106-1 / CGMCC3.15140) TaxID=1229662 RepID=W3WW30_PESFW|nr:uncharacterized protein PFICI_10145 [Pestalotiopsis fici W106-1]ETS78083.1 hypothetical protein PFICI_10145 [Pestalotiopsis fici W106-1]